MVGAGPRGRMLDLGWAALVAAQLGAAAVLDRRGDQLAWPGGSPLGGACLSRALFDVSCPFCGMTRSFVALADGELGAAVGFHPAGPILFAAMVAFLVAVVVVWARRAPPLFARRRFLVGFEAVVLVCMAVGVFKMVRS